jgi:parvulin-like peptidyl-prolyl isomerase
MPREISDEEYAFLQAKRQTADFVESIYNDPQLNKEAKRLIKKKYPNVQIPDYDIEEKVMSRLDQEKKAREDADAAARKKAEDEQFQSVRSQTQKSFGFTDEAMQRLEQLMIERNIGDYEAAAVLMASKEPKASEPTFDNSRWNHDRQEGFKEIATDPEGWARGEILKAVHADEQTRRGQR